MNGKHIVGLAIALVVSITSVQAQAEFYSYQSVRIYSPGFTPYQGIEGSPYFPSDTARDGWVQIGTKRKSVKLRFNTYTNEVEFVQGDKIVTPVYPVTAFMVMMADSMTFLRGFPPATGRTPNDYYQVLYNGRKSKLLRHVFTDVKTNSDAMSNDFGKKTFQRHENFYVWIPTVVPPSENYFEKLSEGEMKSFFLNKKSLVNLFPNQASQIDKYIAEQKLKVKTWNEVASVLSYLEKQ